MNDLLQNYNFNTTLAHLSSSISFSFVACKILYDLIIRVWKISIKALRTFSLFHRIQFFYITIERDWRAWRIGTVFSCKYSSIIREGWFAIFPSKLLSTIWSILLLFSSNLPTIHTDFTSSYIKLREVYRIWRRWWHSFTHIVQLIAIYPFLIIRLNRFSFMLFICNKATVIMIIWWYEFTFFRQTTIASWIELKPISIMDLGWAVDISTRVGERVLVIW